AGVVAQEGKQIADGGEPQPLDDGPLGFAHQFIEVAGAETALNTQTNGRKGARDAAFRLRDTKAFQGPLRPGDEPARVGLTHTPGQDALGLAMFGGRVGAVALAARERQAGLACLVGAGLVADGAAERLAVVGRDRGTEEQPSVAGEQFADPTAP